MLKLIKVAVMIKVGLLVSFAVILLVSIEFAQFIRRCARNPCRERKGITRAVADRYSFLLVRVPSRAVAFGCPMV